MSRRSMRVAGLVLAALLYGTAPASAQATAPDIGSLGTHAIVSDTYTNSLNAGLETAIIGNVCFTTGPATVPVSIVGSSGACPAAAGVDQSNALAILNGQLCTSLGGGAVALNAAVVGANPPGTFPPGCYSSGGAMDITLGSTVTLTGAGVYIFRPGGALTTGANSRVTLAAGACANDVFWAPVGATTIGANAATSPGVPTFVGNIFRGNAAGLSITLGQFAHLTGRALAFGSTVTTDSNTIDVPVCPSFVPPGPPQVTKAFSPDTNGPGGISTLTITLGNGNAAVSTLTAPMVDSLPAGVVLAASPNASTTCGGGVVTATPGGSTITLSTGSTIPAAGSCRVVANVTAAAPGSYTNTIPIAGLQTTSGNNPVAATAILTVSAAIPPVPTLTEWAMIGLAVLLCLGAFLAMRRRRSTN